MHSHARVMERQPQKKKETANKANLNPKIRKCSHWCDDLISCYKGIVGCKKFHGGSRYDFFGVDGQGLSTPLLYTLFE